MLAAAGDPQLRIDEHARSIARLVRVSDGSTHVDLPDHEHAQMLHHLRSIFQIARRGSAGDLITETTRARLLSSGIELARMAVSSRSLRDEFVRSSMLLFFTLGCDIRVPAERATEAAESVRCWLDAPWRDAITRGPALDEGDMGQRLMFAARRRGITEAALRVEALSYFACAGERLQSLVLEALPADAEIDERPLKRVIADPVACSLVEAADADLGQQVRLSPLTNSRTRYLSSTRLISLHIWHLPVKIVCRARLRSSATSPSPFWSRSGRWAGGACCSSTARRPRSPSGSTT